MKISASFFSALLAEEDGQDLVEYALVVALVALFATAALSGVASAATSVMAGIGARLTSAI